MIGGLYGALIQAALVVFIAAGAWWHGFGKGSDVARAEFATRDLQAAREAQIAYAGIVKRRHETEQAWQKSFASVSQEHQKDLAENEKALDTALAGLRSGAIVLRDPGTVGQACGGGSGSPAASPGVGDGSASAGLPPAPFAVLSDEASRFIVEMASDADAVVVQLQACQAILEAERQ